MNAPSPSPSLLGRWAAWYVRGLGVRIFPLLVRRKEPNGLLAPRGYLDASRDPQRITEWWRVAPEANIGLSCVASGVVVIDVDPRNGGDETLRRLVAELGALPKAPTCRTGSGGLHIYFRDVVGAYVGKLGPGVDVKHRGYTVLPPSVHPDGPRYRWELDRHPRDTALAEIPDTWLARMTRREESAAPVVPVQATVDVVERARRYLDRCEGAISGSGGHTHTFLVAQKLVRGFRLDEQTAYALLSVWNQRCKPPWSERDLRRKIHQAATHGTMQPGALLDAPRDRSGGRAA